MSGCNAGLKQGKQNELLPLTPTPRCFFADTMTSVALGPNFLRARPQLAFTSTSCRASFGIRNCFFGDTHTSWSRSSSDKSLTWDKQKVAVFTNFARSCNNTRSTHQFPFQRKHVLLRFPQLKSQRTVVEHLLHGFAPHVLRTLHTVAIRKHQQAFLNTKKQHLDFMPAQQLVVFLGG